MDQEKTTVKKHKRPTRTIAKELHDQWRRLERKNDALELAKLLNVSKPTIDKALIYGSVHQQKIVDGITQYFADRLLREKEAGDQLKQLTTTQTAEPQTSTQ
jgi:endonuclease III-like uncharacterized protein